MIWVGLQSKVLKASFLSPQFLYGNASMCSLRSFSLEVGGVLSSGLLAVTPFEDLLERIAAPNLCASTSGQRIKTVHLHERTEMFNKNSIKYIERKTVFGIVRKKISSICWNNPYFQNIFFTYSFLRSGINLFILLLKKKIIRTDRTGARVFSK